MSAYGGLTGSVSGARSSSAEHRSSTTTGVRCDQWWCKVSRAAFGSRSAASSSTTRAQPAQWSGATECSACKIQMEQGTTKPTLHPIKVLALAYGVMPEIESLLTAKSEELTVT